ncbi:B-cell receptor CD22-like [Trichomycterus rosablanca]|uniref:B-cell receptor CD22-like n=1 Tax=Trichomycterus rosablanca TaxID=2290929 RepID=UPI002F3531D8
MFGITDAQDGWGVTYTLKSISAEKGSTVIMDCTYTYPPGYKVQTVFWSKELHGDGIEPPDLASDPEYRGVVDAQWVWGVTYTQKSICALKGSTVIMDCTYTYPPGYTVQTVFWSKERLGEGIEPPDLASDPEYRGRVQYIGDKNNKCTLKLTDVTEKDQTMYYFRFLTDKPEGKYENTDGVQLHVTDLQVGGPEEVEEGTAVNLTCETTCRLTDNPTFTWYRNQQQLQTTTTYYHSYYTDLHLWPVKIEDGDPPKNISVSVSPSGEIMEGSSVNLTCSAVSNPPVENYTWYKEQTYKGSGETLTVRNISSEDGGEYKCMTSYKNQFKYSGPVAVKVLYPPKNVSASISPSGEIMEGSSVTLTCSSDAKPAASYQWYKGTSYKETGETFTIHKIRSDESGEYKCLARNEHRDQYSTAVNIDVHYPPRSISVSVELSGEITEGSSVTLTCSAVSNPPVENYTWYKEQTYKGSGETLTVRNISSEDGGEYKCKCSYKNQFKYSGPVAVKVLYPPKRVSVSVSSSAEPDQSGLVNLTCSADADPPVESYVWYKEGGSSAVGSGQSYGARPGESYYCLAQNKLGEQTAAALFITMNGGYSMTVCIAVGVGLCLVAAGFVGFFCWRRKMQMRQKDQRDHKDADADAETYAALDPSSRSSNDEYGTLITAHSSPPDDTYATLDPEYETLTTRIQYLGDTMHDCSMMLRGMVEQDEREYFFVIVLTSEEVHYEGGVYLSVTSKI